MSAAQSQRRREGARPGATDAAVGSSSTHAPGVTFCAIDRVGRRAFLSLCTTADWRVFRLDGLAAASDRVSPVQVRRLR